MQLHPGVNVTVRLLHLRDQADDFIQLFVDARVVRHRQCRRRAFEKFVKISIVERGAVRLAFGKSGENFKIVIELAVIRALHQPRHAWHHLRAAQLKTVRPKTARPMSFVQANRLNFCERTDSRVHHPGFSGSRKGA
jgi:hypothetical protein